AARSDRDRAAGAAARLGQPDRAARRRRAAPLHPGRLRRRHALAHRARAARRAARAARRAPGVLVQAGRRAADPRHLRSLPRRRPRSPAERGGAARRRRGAVPHLPPHRSDHDPLPQAGGAMRPESSRDDLLRTGAAGVFAGKPINKSHPTNVGRLLRLRWLVLALLASLPSCNDAPPEEPSHDEWDDKLAERVVDYNAALRVAALRLTGELPTFAELKLVATAVDDGARKTVYENMVRQYLTGPRFSRQMYRFWQDTLKMGDDPALDTAPAFLTKLAVEDTSYLQALTATGGTCPRFDPTTGA